MCVYIHITYIYICTYLFSFKKIRHEGQLFGVATTNLQWIEDSVKRNRTSNEFLQPVF